MVSLIITSFVNQFPSISYEVTDQNSEGIFSSLSRNFDKTLEHINSGDNTATSPDDKDDKKSSDTHDDKTVSEKEGGADAIKSEPNNDINVDLKNSNATESGESDSDTSEEHLLVNSTESIEIEPVDLKTPL